MVKLSAKGTKIFHSDNSEEVKVIFNVGNCKLSEKDLDESIQIFDKGGVDKINFVIKTNLLNFVWRFERENISLVEFAKDIDYAKKIDLIQTKFKEYAKQLTDESQQRPED